MIGWGDETSLKRNERDLGHGVESQQQQQQQEYCSGW